MNKTNVNGQNGVATSAVTSVMASAFAAEMDSIFAKATSTRKNFPIINFLCNVKVGTKKETMHGIKRNMLVTLLAPYGTSTMKGWVYQVNGKVSADSVVWLLESAIDYITKFENHLNDYKAGATNFTKKFIEVVEQYGVADLERRIAEVHQYFTDLAGVEEQENEQDIDIEYLINEFNENMKSNVVNDFQSTLQTIVKFCGGEYDTESEHICGGFNYERDYEHEWVEFYVNETGDSYDNAYNVFREYWEFIINEDTMKEYVDSLENVYGVGIEDNSWGECLLWVKNPYYKAPKNDTPCLDIDIAVDRVVNTIKSYLANYVPSYLDQFGDCVITIGWDNFSEEDMKMLIENDIFEGLVIDNLVGENISDMLVYDNGVYVTVDYDKMFNKVAEKQVVEQDIIEYIYGLDSRPSWVTRNDINVVDSDSGDYLDIVMFGSYHVGLYYDSSESVYDFAKVDSSSAYSVEDMRYAVEIMENRDYIVSLAKKVLAKCGFNKVA